MFEWKKNYKWVFSNLGASDKVGVNESGIGIFKKQPYKGLTKEILQNVTDAKNNLLPDDIPVIAKFELIYVDRDDIPDVSKLNYVIHKCYEYYSEGDDGEKLKRIKNAADKYLGAPHKVKVPVLKISDFNTIGLRGVCEEKGTNWTGLVRERSATNKTNSSSGAFGVGKFAPYNFSSLRTVLYSTVTRDNETAFQGKALLTTFKDNNILKQNIGLFANEEGENFDAIFDANDIAPVFRRDKIGTDIFVLGFEKENDWVEQSVISVIEHFFYSIYIGNLEVEIIDGDKKVIIKKDNLGEMITSYNNYYKKNMSDDSTFYFTAPLYWQVLTNNQHKKIKKPFEYNGHAMGNYELYLLIGADASERKVLEMRQAGMKIREDISFRIPVNFTGIFIATGEGAISEEPKDNISSFLRKCENQAHDDWAADEYEEEKNKARGIINKIHSIILEAVKEEMPDFGGESVDAFGLSEFLPNIENEENIMEEQAFSDFRPHTFEIQSVRTGKPIKHIDISMKTNGGSKHRDMKEKRKKTQLHKRTNNKKGTSIYKASEIYISKIKTPYNNSLREYQISFIVDENVDNLMLGIKIGSDDDSVTDAKILRAYTDKKILILKNGLIEIGKVTNGERKIVHVRLAELDRKTLEVRAYAKR